MKKKDLLLKVFEKCYEISTTTKTDVFFDYAPHVNCFDVYYHLHGWSEKDTPDHIASCETITTKNLQDALIKLEELEKEAE